MAILKQTKTFAHK